MKKEIRLIMYIPKYFEIQDQEIIYDIMKEYSFATLFSQHQGKPYVTHLPFTVDRVQNVLIGHIARANPQWRDFLNQEVLVVFQGPHCYISPTWYETNREVPTWNYIAVHVYGEIEIIEKEQELLESLRDMVQKYEDENSTYQWEDVDQEFVKGLMKGLVGFKININKIEAKGKLSQNKSKERREMVIQHLEEIASEDTQQIAFYMKKFL